MIHFCKALDNLLYRNNYCVKKNVICFKTSIVSHYEILWLLLLFFVLCIVVIIVMSVTINTLLYVTKGTRKKPGLRNKMDIFMKCLVSLDIITFFPIIVQ